MNSDETTERTEAGRRNPTRRVRRFFQALSETRRNKGLFAAARLGLSLATEIVMRPISNRQDERLDRRLGVGTQRVPGQVTVPLPVAAAAAYDDAVAYSPTPGHRFKEISRGLPIAKPESFTFIDLGCGKGRTLVLAAQLGYRRVIGIEFDPDLVAAARRNIEALQATSPDAAEVIDVVAADAAEYEFPPDPTVVFLFNPFGEDTLSAVIKAIEGSLQQSPRPFFVAYYNPMHHNVLDASPSFQRIVDNPRWTAYEAIGPKRPSA